MTTTNRLPTWALALILLIAAIALRCSVYGNPAPMADDQFYALVGARMHHGLLPYVDVWDRKPLGLFLIYYALAAISPAPVVWQVAATLSAAATALTIARLAETIPQTPRPAALLAGLTYLATLGPLDGYSGQSPVFYNLPIALAALLAYRPTPAKAATTALLCGLAITIKQTALFESALLLGWILAHTPRAHLIPRALTLALLVTLPTLACATFYAAHHHFAAWWQAMVLSNLVKAPLTAREIHGQAASTAVRLAPLLAVTLAALATQPKSHARTYLALWLAAATVGFLSVPHYFAHYALPALVPLTVTAASLFARPSAGRPAALALIAWTFVWYHPWDRAWQMHSRTSVTALASAAVQHDHGRGLLVFDGPTSVYALANRPFLTPLVFPHHLNQLAERNVSQFDTNAEVARVLAAHPGAVISTLAPRNFPVNWTTWRAVQTYVHANCHPVALVQTWDERFVTPIMVWGDCAPASQDRTPK